MRAHEDKMEERVDEDERWESNYTIVNHIL